MVNNNPATYIMNIMSEAKKLIQCVETGEGLNIPEDKKEEFKQKMKEQGADKMIEELNNKMKEFGELSKKMNHVPTN